MKYNFNFKRTSLYLAIKKGNIDIVKTLLTDPNININEKTVFFL